MLLGLLLDNNLLNIMIKELYLSKYVLGLRSAKLVINEVLRIRAFREGLMPQRCTSSNFWYPGSASEKKLDPIGSKVLSYVQYLSYCVYHHVPS